MKNQFKINERVRLVNDWLPPEAKAKQVVITAFQNNGELFAHIRWTGSNAKQFTEQFGTLFPLTELRKI